MRKCEIDKANTQYEEYCIAMQGMDIVVMEKRLEEGRREIGWTKSICIKEERG